MGKVRIVPWMDSERPVDVRWRPKGVAGGDVGRHIRPDTFEHRFDHQRHDRHLRNRLRVGVQALLVLDEAMVLHQRDYDRVRRAS